MWTNTPKIPSVTNYSSKKAEDLGQTRPHPDILYQPLYKIKRIILYKKVSLLHNVIIYLSAE